MSIFDESKVSRVNTGKAAGQFAEHSRPDAACQLAAPRAGETPVLTFGSGDLRYEVFGPYEGVYDLWESGVLVANFSGDANEAAAFQAAALDSVGGERYETPAREAINPVFIFERGEHSYAVNDEGEGRFSVSGMDVEFSTEFTHAGDTAGLQEAAEDALTEATARLGSELTGYKNVWRRGDRQAI